LTTRPGRYIERFSYADLVLAALVTVLVSAALLFLLTPFGNGLQGTAIQEDPQYGFALLGNAVYFSIVTFSSLGYGEITPVGLGRLVSCGEVAVGLSLIALLIGKLASERQSAILVALLSSDMERRLSGFAERLSVCNAQLNVLCAARASKQLAVTMGELYGAVVAIKRYVAFNGKQFPAAFNNNASAVAAVAAQVPPTYQALVRAIEADLVAACGAEGVQVTCGELVRLLEVLRAFPPGKATPVKQAVQATDRIIERHAVWREQQARNALMDQVLALAPDRTLSRWPKGHHKVIAAQLNISHGEITRCVDAHLQRGTLSR
jgi:hypothetical protein